MVPSRENLSLAEEVCGGIGDRRLRLVTLLRSVPSIPPEALAPASLYEALARIESLQDECHGLMALLEAPADPRGLLQRFVLPIRDPLIRTRAMLRLACHTLAFEIACHAHPDRLLPLELVRWMITTETDEELASLTPEIAELGAGAGGKRATTEVQEAARQLAALEVVEWPVRREALEGLLARVAAGLLPDAEAAKALVTILRLPIQLRPETARQQLRQRWHEILPLIAAAADRLPDKHRRPVRRALQESQRDFSRDAVLPKIFALCLATAAERENTADSISTDDNSELQAALAYLLTKHSPRLVPEVVRRLPVPDRASLALRLIRYSWIPKDRARELMPCVAGEASEAETEIWCGPENGDEAAWTERAALWIADEGPPPSDPHIEPLLSRLWSASDLWRPALAWAVQDSLRRGALAVKRSCGPGSMPILPPVRDAVSRKVSTMRQTWRKPSALRRGSGRNGARCERCRRYADATSEKIASRWPRYAWDYRGLARWLSFDESYWTAVLAVGLLFSTIYLDVLLWAPGAGPLPIVGELGESPAGRVLLVVLILFNGWVVDRLLSARTPSYLREILWVRVTRAILAAIPLLGLAMIPLWQRLTRIPPSWAFTARSKTVLNLGKNLPAGLGPEGFQTRIDTRLKSWSQRLALQIAWLVGCQIAPWFSVLYLLGRDRSLTTVIVCVLLHVAGAGAALAHSTLRSSLLQMTPGRALAFRLLPLGLLLPVPFSFLPVLLWLPASEDKREDQGVIQTLYRTRAARRHPLAATRRPRQEEILGGSAHRWRQAAAGKIFLLFLESAALSRLAAAFGFFLLPVWALPDHILLLLTLPTLPGVVLFLVGVAGRSHKRFPRLAALANHPSGASLTLVPPVFLLGTLSGVLDASFQTNLLAILLLMVGFLGANAALLAMIWSFVLSIFSGTPDRPYTGKFVAICLFLIPVALSSVLARPPVFLGLTSLSVLVSPFMGIVIATRWLAPFRLRDLKDPRLPLPLRALLGGIALTAILPLGALALPWWGQVRHQRGPELDRWAARLRESSA